MPAGRPKGSLNKTTADVKALAQNYTGEAIETLAKIMRKSGSDTARIAAVKELLDRGYGKAVQGVELTGKDGQPVEFKQIERVIVRSAD